MARLSDTEWAKVRAEYEVKHLSDHELSRLFGVSNTAIRKKAIKDGWIKGGSSQLVDAKLKIIKDISDLSSQSSQLSSQHLSVIDSDVAFRLRNDKDLEAIQVVANKMLAQVDNPSALLALVTITVKHREARLGKSPDTAIQINTSGAQVKTLDDFYRNA